MNQFSYHFQTLSNDITLGYIDEGEGPPMVMIHGATGTAMRHFDSMIGELRSNYRIIAPDLRGYGKSSPPFRDFPPHFIQRDADDVALLLETLNCQPAIIFGFSDGGEAALTLAANRPDLARAVVAWGAFGVETSSTQELFESFLPVEDWGPDFAEWRDAIIANHGEEQLIPMITGRVEAMRASVAAGGDLGLSKVHLIQCPTLLVYGDQEERQNSAEVAELASRIPDCRLEIIPDSDHFIQREQPEKFMAVINSFLLDLE